MYQALAYSERKADRVTAGVSVVDDRFATEPIPVVKPAEQQLSEEELHTLFEQAISDRVQAVSARLSHISGPLARRPHTSGYECCAASLQIAPSTEPLRQRSDGGLWPSLLSNTWRHGITLASLALLLVMSGFDLMGLLVLHMR